MENINNARLEIKMPAVQRRALDNFAGEIGLSSSDAARLAISDMLARRTVTVVAPPQGALPVEAVRMRAARNDAPAASVRTLFPISGKGC
jgi:hypothetical protein